MKNDKWQFVVRTSDFYLSLFICHFSLVICQVFLCALCGREKKCSAGFQPANGPGDAKGVIQAHMPARRRRYDSFSRPASPRWLVAAGSDFSCKSFLPIRLDK